MAKNRILFQKGLSLAEFQNQYGTEERYRKALFQWSWPKGFRCPACEGNRFCILFNVRYQCNNCRHQTSLTSGTLLACTKLPLTVWFLAIYLLTLSKNAMSALDLKRQLGVSYNTDWLLKHKILQVMKERDDGLPLDGAVQIDDAYWGEERRGGKRGRGAPGKTPFLAAVQCTDDGRPLRLRLTRVQGFPGTRSNAGPGVKKKKVCPIFRILSVHFSPKENVPVFPENVFREVFGPACVYS